MKDIKDFMINESTLTDIKAFGPESISTKNKDYYPVFKFPDGKEYILKPYNSKHQDNGRGANHIGLEFVEFNGD